MELSIKTQTGAFDIEAVVIKIGSDLLLAIWGGDKPHIGAVAAAQARPSLKDPAVTSATASVICFPAHKEYDLVRRASEKISAAVNTSVVVSAGIHWDNITAENIETIMKNCDLLVELILQKLLELPQGDIDGG